MTAIGKLHLLPGSTTTCILTGAPGAGFHFRAWLFVPPTYWLVHASSAGPRSARPAAVIR